MTLMIIGSPKIKCRKCTEMPKVKKKLDQFIKTEPNNQPKPTLGILI
jgi:hypothetical protein